MVRFVLVIAALAALPLSCTLAAEVPPPHTPAGDAATGAQTSRRELCQECHGEDGNSEDTQFPKLAGQQGAYIAKQLRDFQTGARRDEIMTVMAESLAESDRQDIAAYFASQPQTKAHAAVDRPTARALFERGDARRGIAACASCHGPDGHGQDMGAFVVPRIAGQRYFYLRGQIDDWRSGNRRNSPGGLMNDAAKQLGDAEIDALADYLAGL